MTACSCFGKKSNDIEQTEKPNIVPVETPTARTASIPGRTKPSAAKSTSAVKKNPLIDSEPPANVTSSKKDTIASETIPAAKEQATAENSVPAIAPIASDPTPQQTSPPADNKSTPEMADALKGAASGVTNTVSSGATNTVSSGAQQAGSGAQSAASTAQDTVTGSGSEGTQKWDAMTEEQKKATYDALPEDKKKGKTYYEWVSEGYQNQKENWMPWIEDFYLKWFTKDNKASYATKEGLDKTKVTGIEQVDTLQDGVNNLVGQQVGKGGLLQPVGDMASSEGINRAERGGKDEKGSYLGPADSAVASAGGKEEQGTYIGSAGGAVSSAGGSVLSGAKSAGGYVGGMFGGKKEGAEESK